MSRWFVNRMVVGGVGLASLGVGATLLAEETPIDARHYRQYRAVPTDLYNASFMSWAGDNLVDRLATGSPEAAEARARELADLGLTGVLYNGRHFRLNFAEEWPSINEHARWVTEAAHRHGISVIEHHQMTIFSYKGYGKMLEHLPWLQRDIRTGESARWVCSGNPDFLQFYGDYLTTFQQVAGVDGYMLDELAPAHKNACGCDACRTAFYRDTGHHLPDRQLDDPAARDDAQAAWAAWRSLTSARANVVLMDRIRQVRPDAARMTYGSDYSDSHTVGTGQDLARDAALYGSFMGWEAMIAEALNGWRPFLRSLVLRNSMGDYFGIPLWSLNRELTTPEAVYFGWALCQLGKHGIWYGARGLSTEDELAAFKRYNTWPHVMPHEHARTLTRAAVLLSHQTRQANIDRDFYWHDFAGWVDMLLEGNRNFDTILDGDLYFENRLEKYDVLILPSQACLADAQLRRLEAWVRAGGTAILTRNTALHDEHGRLRENFGLADAANLQYRGQHRPGSRVSGRLGDTEVSFVTRQGMAEVAVQRPNDPATRVLVQGAQPSQAAVIETRFGRGRFLYVAADLGTQNVEMELRNRTRYRTREDSQMRDAIWALYDHAHRRQPPVSFQLPRGVIATAYQQQGGEEAGRLYIHLLNTTGKHMEPGYTSAFGRPEAIPLPPVTEPLVIEFRVPLRGTVRVQTPEHEGERAVAPREVASGVWQVTVPGEWLGAYLQLDVDAAPLPGQEIRPVPLAPHLLAQTVGP